MAWWLIGILGYLAALGLVLILAGGVRRGDRLHAEALRELEGANLDGTDGMEPRDTQARPAAPRRPAPRLHPSRRVANR